MTSAHLLCLTVAACLNGLAPATSHGQRPSHDGPAADTIVVIERLCDTCSIAATRIVTLGSDEGPGAVGRPALVALDARGRYWVSSVDDPVIQVYDSAGTFLRTVGRNGDGPGEFRMINVIKSSPMGVHVFDNASARWTKLNLDFRLSGTSTVQGEPHSARIVEDGAILGAIVPTRNAVGFTLHKVNDKGQIVRSFGDTQIPYREDLRHLFQRTIGEDSDSLYFWAARQSEYAFERCSAESFHCQLFVREARWFRPHTRGIEPNRSESPAPVLVAVSSDNARYVWTLVWVADARWRSAVGGQGHTQRITDISKYFDTVVERIDVLSGQVVASRRIDLAIEDFIGPSMVYAFRLDENDIPRVEIMRLAAASEVARRPD